MNRAIRFWLLLSLVLLPGSVLAEEASVEEPILKVGDTMPDFTLKDGLSGQQVRFEENIRGKSEAIAFVFFNTGCSACMAEMEEVSKAAKELGDQKLRLYGFAVDKRGEQAVKAYNNIYGFKATYLLDPTFSIPARFGFNFTPAGVILDGQGKIVFLKGGYNPVKDSGLFAREIRALLKLP
jgi:peroxiredoxin